MPLFYIIVVLILLANYIFDSQKTSFTWGELSVRITTNEKNTPSLLHNAKNLSLEKIGVSFVRITLPQAKITFSTHSSISTNREYGILSTIAALPSGDGFVLSFGDKTFISFQTNLLKPKEVSIIVHAQPKDQIQFPVFLPLGTKSSLIENSLLLSRANLSSKVLASSYAYFSQTKTSLSFVSQSTHTSFHFSIVQSNTPPTITRIPTLSLNTKKEAEQSVVEYIDKAFLSWTSKRFNTSLGAWKQPEGFFGFSEKILVSTYAEAMKRQELPRIKIALDKAAFLNKHALSWRSANFTLNGHTLIPSLFEDITSTQQYILTEIANNNRTILNNLSLWQTIPLWKNKTNQQEFYSFLTATPPVNTSPEISAILLHQSIINPWKELNHYVNTNNKIFEQNIINNTVIANKGYLLLNSNKNIDVFSSIIAGKYLSSYASLDSLKRLGARMLQTALSLSDDYGVLPQLFVYNNPGFVSLGYITPETIYPILSSNSLYPKIKKSKLDSIFYLSNSPITVKPSSNNIQLSIHNPENEITQYVYVWPIPKPNRIYAFDVFWTGKTFPQNFSQGISYNSTYELLIIKMLSRNQEEIIALEF